MCDKSGITLKKHTVEHDIRYPKKIITDLVFHSLEIEIKISE